MSWRWRARVFAGGLGFEHLIQAEEGRWELRLRCLDWGCPDLSCGHQSVCLSKLLPQTFSIPQREPRFPAAYQLIFPLLFLWLTSPLPSTQWFPPFLRKWTNMSRSPEYVPSTALGTLHGLSSFILKINPTSFLYYFRGSEAEGGEVTCPKCTAGKQRHWDLNPGSRTSEFTLLTTTQYFGHLMRRADSLEKTDAGKDWRQEEKGTAEDKMVGWHHWLNRHEFEQAPGVGDEQGSLACCSLWVAKSRTQLSDWTEPNHHPYQLWLSLRVNSNS